MRQRLAIIVTVTVVVVLLVALNTASYVTTERPPDTESVPDRSTYNPGTTGTLAFYDLLAESGRPVMRWSSKPDALLDAAESGTGPRMFVVIGRTRAPFEAEEVGSLLKWVERGGSLLLIDRRPDVRLLPASAHWRVSTSILELPERSLRPESADEMTTGMPLVHATIPSIFTRNLQSVLPSKFAGAINISVTTNAPVAGDDGEDKYGEPPPAQVSPLDLPSGSPPANESPAIVSPVPIAHLEDHRGALLVDYPHGAGRIIVLSDPFIVANNGIGLADNLQLGINAVSSSGGIIAFDEYHQGRGASRNQLMAYFAGTPVMWMFAQAILIVLVILWTRGRRFGRALPVARVDRRSSLEFVASMAELQQRARAFDLAIENIYTRLRRVLVRYGGLSHNTRRSEIASRVASRSTKMSATRLETLMRECEDAINGAPLDAKKALSLVRQLRTVERVLGLRMRSREARQTAEGLQQDTL